MSEKIYACLLRLYPYRFRKVYKEDALLLYRERLRDETGFFRRLRLYFDLLVDVVAGLPQAYRNSYPLPAAALVAYNNSGIPSFLVLERQPLPFGSIVVAFTLTLIGLATFSFMMTRPVAASSTESSNKHMSAIESVLERLNQPSSQDPVDSDTEDAGGPASSEMPGSKAQAPAAMANTKSAQAMPPIAEANQIRRGVEVPVMRENRAASPVADGSSFAAQLPASVRTTPNLNSGKSQTSTFAGQPRVEDASAAMIRLLQAHGIVMLGEVHGNKQEYEWLCKLVKTPGFADQVDDIVVEFGNSLYQKTVDRYIAGEDVPMEQVQKAWRNMVGAVGPVSPVYGWFYKAVRESNLQRPGGHKIRLLLGDPSADWNKIHNTNDLAPYLSHRDQWYAQIVKNEVLSQNHHALLIMGAGHFLRRNGPGAVEQVIRAAGLHPYLVVFGTNTIGSYNDLDRRFDSWSVPAIVGLSGNWVGNLPAMPVLTGGSVAPNSLKLADAADALLYLGQRDALTAVNVPQSELVGTPYGKEIERRLRIQTGQTMNFTQASETPQFPRTFQQASR